MNQWIDPAEREKLRKKQEESEKLKQEAKKQTKLTFDFAGRKIFVEKGKVGGISKVILG